MPRSAESQPELALQGSLFGEPEPAAAAGRPPADEPIAASGGLSDADLGADAIARPRKRQTPQASSVLNEASDADTTEDSTNDDQPAWAHHSQVDPAQLTPMLRHYVELKAAHPERVLLYRLGDFFECFFEDAIIPVAAAGAHPHRQGRRQSHRPRAHGRHPPPRRRALLQ